MDQITSSDTAGHSWRILALSVALLAAAIIPAALLAALVCSDRTLAHVVICAGVGGGVCYLAGALALAATWLGNQWQSPVQAMLVGMIFRMGLPLCAIVVLSNLGLAWAAGAASTIVGVYLIALVVETVLSLRMVPSQSRVAKAT